MKSSVALSLLFASTALWAQAPQVPPPPLAPPATAPAQDEARPGLVVRPSLAPVEAAFQASGLAQARPVLTVTYDAQGVVTDAVLKTPSGNAALDQAVLDWGRAARLSPGKAGSGSLPFDLVNDEALPATPIDVDAKTLPEIQYTQIASRPSLGAIQKAVADARVVKADAELLLVYDGDGRITGVQVLDSSGSLAIDAAIREWASQVRLKTTVAGAGRLPFSFESH